MTTHLRHCVQGVAVWLVNCWNLQVDDVELFFQYYYNTDHFHGYVPEVCPRALHSISFFMPYKWVRRWLLSVITNPLSFFVVSGSTETWMNVIPFVIIHKYSCMTIQHSATKEESKYRLYLLMDRLSLCTPINSLLCWTSMRVGLCTCTHVSVWLDLVLSYQSRGNRLLLLLSTW